jgi:hypothetical protein
MGMEIIGLGEDGGKTFRSHLEETSAKAKRGSFETTSI